MVLYSPLIALIIMSTIFGGALAGMLLATRIPVDHLSEATKSIVGDSMRIVGTMSALVIGLLVASANTSFTARNANVAQLSIDLLKMENILHRYGSDADPIRHDLNVYSAMTYHDLFSKERHRRSVENEATNDVLSEIQDRLIDLKPADDRHRWLASQALQISSDISAARWLLVQEQSTSFPIPFLMAVVLWLTILFMSFGLFSPRNLTAVLVILVCAFAVSGALKLMLDMEAPFEGGIRLSSPPIHLSSDPLRHVLDVLGQ
jgi:hypothetical protein